MSPAAGRQPVMQKAPHNDEFDAGSDHGQATHLSQKWDQQTKPKHLPSHQNRPGGPDANVVGPSRARRREAGELAANLSYLRPQTEDFSYVHTTPGRRKKHIRERLRELLEPRARRCTREEEKSMKSANRICIQDSTRPAKKVPSRVSSKSRPFTWATSPSGYQGVTPIISLFCLPMGLSCVFLCKNTVIYTH